MSKYDAEIKAARMVPSGLGNMLGGLGETFQTEAEHHDALAHFLSGDEGWHDARSTLRGAFAKPPRGGTVQRRVPNK